MDGVDGVKSETPEHVESPWRAGGQITIDSQASYQRRADPYTDKGCVIRHDDCRALPKLPTCCQAGNRRLWHSHVTGQNCRAKWT